jgi:hypothetical protein
MMMIRKSSLGKRIRKNKLLTYLNNLLNRNEYELARRAPAFHGETNVQR